MIIIEEDEIYLNIQYPLFIVSRESRGDRWNYGYFKMSERKPWGNRLVYNISGSEQIVYNDELEAVEVRGQK